MNQENLAKIYMIEIEIVSLPSAAGRKKGVKNGVNFH